MRNELSLIIDKFWNNDEELKLLLDLFEKNQLAEVFYLGYLAKKVVENGIPPKYIDNLIKKLAGAHNIIYYIETNNIYLKYAQVYTMYYLNLFYDYKDGSSIFRNDVLMSKTGDILHEYPLFLSTFILAGNISDLKMSIYPRARECCEQLIQYAERGNIYPDMYLNAIPMYIKQLFIKPSGYPVNYNDLEKGDRLLNKYASLTYIKNEGFMFL